MRSPLADGHVADQDAGDFGYYKYFAPLGLEAEGETACVLWRSIRAISVILLLREPP